MTTKLYTIDDDIPMPKTRKPRNDALLNSLSILIVGQSVTIEKEDRAIIYSYAKHKGNKFTPGKDENEQWRAWRRE